VTKYTAPREFTIMDLSRRAEARRAAEPVMAVIATNDLQRRDGVPAPGPAPNGRRGRNGMSGMLGGASGQPGACGTCPFLPFNAHETYLNSIVLSFPPQTSPNTTYRADSDAYKDITAILIILLEKPQFFVYFMYFILI